jgi:GR25 family glycosyltransferase involved in LPS biosynthesis
MMENDLPYALILEDDACFDKSWRDKLSTLVLSPEELQTFGVVMLNASEPCSPTFQWVQAKEQFLTGGYIISLSGARWILKQFGTQFYSSDWMVRTLQLAMKSYCYFPWLVIQENRDSVIGSAFDESQAKVVSCLNSIGYDLKNYE